MILVK